jgi:hypothetical protein
MQPTSTHPEMIQQPQRRPRCRRYIVFRGMVESTDEQRQIVQEVLLVHHQSTHHTKNNATNGPSCPVHDEFNEDVSLDTIHPLNTIKEPLEPSFWQDPQTLQTSRKLDLGLSYCGADVTKQLPIATAIARRAFARAAQEAEQSTESEFLHDHGSIDTSATTTTTKSFHSSLQLLRAMGQHEPEQEHPVQSKNGKSTTTSITTTPLTGLSLLYGPLASMSAHYDSPTQPGQREEWLAMMSIGSSIIFRCNDELIQLDSGDVVVMDSMATLHGVERVLAVGVSTGEGMNDDVGDSNRATNNINYAELGLQTPCRLGLLFWRGRPKDKAALTLPSQDEELTPGESLLDGVGDLFADESDENE